MFILRNPASIKVTDTDINCLANLRFIQICAGEAYDFDKHDRQI